MKNNDLHTKIETTLKSLDGIRRAEANPFLLTRVLEQMNSGARELVKPSLVWPTLVSLILVIGLNVAIGLYTSYSGATQETPSESVYFSNHQYNY